MVKICSLTHYPEENDEKYKSDFLKYTFELSIFQKYAIEAINEGHHVLVTAHTGSGKTLPAEHAIEHFVSKGKKVIYTGPVKSLINQKFNDFNKKYVGISFGILTGDIKFNPEAQVLIMTTEILMNKLYQLKNPTNIKTNIDFNIDFETELACVIFDEVHFINNSDRGYVWESSIMMLPKHVQLVMLSATIDKPELFASWCESVHKDSDKQVYLTNTTHRVVPITNYSFITLNQGSLKLLKDKTLQEHIKSIINKPIVIQDSKGKFMDENFFKVYKLLKLFQDKDFRVKRSFVLNQVTQYLTENEMLPALCFVLNRKQVEVCANEITTNLLEFDSKVPYTIDKECEQILRSKLTNYEEYLNLPEYTHMVSLLRKGIAIHHSGIIPVLKEIVEILYAKGYIKLLFATETFSIGVNMPTKTVLFTDVNKFDGHNVRTLHAHEFSQMMGRAGRRGMDKVGHVIHLNNLFRDIDTVTYKTMMNGKPQTLTSKFKLSYNLLLNILSIDNSDQACIDFTKKSMITGDLESKMGTIYAKMTKAQTELDNINTSSSQLRTPIEVMEEYQLLTSERSISVNKRRREIERKLQQIKEEFTSIMKDIDTYNKITDKEKEINGLKADYDQLHEYFNTGIVNVTTLLRERGFVDDVNTLTELGKIACQIRETHCLIFAKLYADGDLASLSSAQLVALFSCFTNIRVADDVRSNKPQTEDKKVNELVSKIAEEYDTYRDIETSRRIDTGVEEDFHYDLMNFVERWCETETVEDCKLILQELESKKGIFLGEFVKALLKINNVASEFEKIAEMTGNIEFLSKLRDIPMMTLKYVVTNQSLYV